MVRKINISHTLICTNACAYHGVRNLGFSKNFAYVLNKSYPYDLVVCIYQDCLLDT